MGCPPQTSFDATCSCPSFCKLLRAGGSAALSGLRLHWANRGSNKKPSSLVVPRAIKGRSGAGRVGHLLQRTGRPNKNNVGMSSFVASVIAKQIVAQSASALRHAI